MDLIDELWRDYPGFRTAQGCAICADSRDVLARMPDDSIDLIVTSPPYLLQAGKKGRANNSYTNITDETSYLDWFLGFCRSAKPKLKETGSLVVNLGNSWAKGRPVQSLYPYRFILGVCDLGYVLCQEVIWYSRSTLPKSEYVTVWQERAKDAWEHCFWLAKADRPKAHMGAARTPYSESQLRDLRRHKGAELEPRHAVNRPGGSSSSNHMDIDHGGALPTTVLEVSRGESTSTYIRSLRRLGLPLHPARFPEGVPSWFIKVLTDPDDLVVDIFGGSSTTGHAAETLGRRWVTIDTDPRYVGGAVARWTGRDLGKTRDCYDRIMAGEHIEIGVDG